MLRIYLDWLRERLTEANSEAQESHRAAMNSYGAGYDRGYADALQEALTQLGNPGS